MSNDLRLNSLERFQKTSERLLLEEHAHCEVPAGCGGVVLRWFNPNSGVPVILHAGFADQMTIFVDEVRAASGRVTVPHGEHVLAVHAVFEEASTRYFWLAGLVDSPVDRYPDENRIIPALASRGDDSWLATAEDPSSPRWTASDYDDSQWTPLQATELRNLHRSTQWHYDRMRELGAACLGWSGSREQSGWLQRLAGRIRSAEPLPSEVWIRKRFRMEA
jgi:hypothetical protein